MSGMKLTEAIRQLGLCAKQNKFDPPSISLARWEDGQRLLKELPWATPELLADAGPAAWYVYVADVSVEWPAKVTFRNGADIVYE